MESLQGPSVWFPVPSTLFKSLLLALTWNHGKSQQEECKGMVINDLVYHCTDWEHEDQREIAICPKTHSFIIQCHSWITGVPETRIYHRGGVRGRRHGCTGTRTEVRCGTSLMPKRDFAARGECVEFPHNSRSPSAPPEDATRKAPYVCG